MSSPAPALSAQFSQARVMHHRDPSTAIHDTLAPQPGDIVAARPGGGHVHLRGTEPR